MSAIINWDFSVNRWADTMMEVAYRDGTAEVDMRCENLPPDFKARVIASLEGRDTDGQPY